MRIPIILLVLQFGLASLGAAQATDQSQPAPGSAAPSRKSELVNNATEAMPIGKFHLANERRHDVSPVGIFDVRNLRPFHFEGDRENVCYKMRSYIMARENGDSDSTKLVGYSTCQPSSKYQLRITVDDSNE
jgi:hypothetical protein